MREQLDMLYKLHIEPPAHTVTRGWMPICDWFVFLPDKLSIVGVRVGGGGKGTR